MIRLVDYHLVSRAYQQVGKKVTQYEPMGRCLVSNKNLDDFSIRILF
jgi:hypothetical protein